MHQEYVKNHWGGEVEILISSVRVLAQRRKLKGPPVTRLKE